MTQRPGTSYEDIIRERHPEFQKTSNSGATHGDGDLRHPNFLVEAKDRGTEGFSLPRKEFLKLQRQSANWSRGQWAYFFRNRTGEEVVILNRELFEEMLEVLHGALVAECPKCKTEIEMEFDW